MSHRNRVGRMVVTRTVKTWKMFIKEYLPSFPLHVCVCICHSTCPKGRGQLTVLSAHCMGPWGLNSGHQAWSQHLYLLSHLATPSPPPPLEQVLAVTQGSWNRLGLLSSWDCRCIPLHLACIQILIRWRSTFRRSIIQHD